MTAHHCLICQRRQANSRSSKQASRGACAGQDAAMNPSALQQEEIPGLQKNLLSSCEKEVKGGF
jgi:hypothetical protein